MSKTDELLLWTDIETTGLDPHTARILEVGLRVTDLQGMELDRLSRVVKPEWLPTHTSPTAYDLHMDNGLLAQVFHADARTAGPELVADAMIGFAARYSADNTLVPAGTNVWHFDLPCIKCFFGDKGREFVGMLHYRCMDMSTLRTVGRAWGADPYAGRPKGTHRVDDCLDRDIREYREFVEAHR